MVSTTVLAAAVGAMASATGSAIIALAHVKRTRIQENEKSNRREAELYLQRKVDALTELHEKIAALQNATSGYSTEFYNVAEMTPKFRDEKEEVMAAIDEAQEAHSRASIYLSPAETAVIQRAIWQATNVYERMAEESGSSWADVDYDEGQYNEAFRYAEGVLKLTIDKPASQYFNGEKIDVEEVEEHLKRIESGIEANCG